MYGISELADAIQNPHLVLRELNRLYHTRFWTRSHNPHGVDIFQQDWDNLILLDACRYDTFADRVELPGNLSSKTSRAGATSEFIRGNFPRQNLLDTVYVTRNTWFLKLQDELDVDIHALYHLIDPSPRPITEKALQAADRHPNKRLLIHYLPPHHPFVGPTANEYLPPYDKQSNDLFGRIQRGELDISDETLHAAYAENLDRVVPEVERLIEELDGKTVVTADHGELLGDTIGPIPITDYGHHPGLYVDELVKVPWLECASQSRRRIVAEPASEEHTASVADELVDERLRNLGYKI